jgi:hypothetical protein
VLRGLRKTAQRLGEAKSLDSKNLLQAPPRVMAGALREIP